MNKQQLAAKIWESANRMRSKIEANEYKDYILGFIFYKYLSDREEQWLLAREYAKEDIKEYVNEEDEETVRNAQRSLGYFIAYKDLFSTWIHMGSDFSVDNVRTALSSFTRLISEFHKKVFDGIFNTLETGLSKLGESTKSQTKAVSDLIRLIDEIPMNGKQDYDVLGFIYEYLISIFAANAGKKAGEFYTPREVSLLMSEIVANHLKGREEIKIYDKETVSDALNETNDAFVIKNIKDVIKVLKEDRLANENLITVLQNAETLSDREKKLRNEIRSGEEALHIKAKETIEGLSEAEVHKLLHEKWAAPILSGILELADDLIDGFTKDIQKLAEKYSVTMNDLEEEIRSTEASLSSMLSDLTGSAADMAGIRELQKLLG